MKTRFSWVIALAIMGLGANSYGAVTAPAATDGHGARVHATTAATPPPKKPAKPTKPKKPTSDHLQTGA
jgi:hypothetical protein